MGRGWTRSTCKFPLSIMSGIYTPRSFSICKEGKRYRIGLLGRGCVSGNDGGLSILINYIFVSFEPACNSPMAWWIIIP
jgi:hypothetical protein